MQSLTISSFNSSMVCFGKSACFSAFHIFSTGLGTQPRYKALIDLQVEIVENAVINIGLMRLSPLKWPKVGLGTTKQRLKKNPCCVYEIYNRKIKETQFSNCLMYCNAQLYPAPKVTEPVWFINIRLFSRMFCKNKFYSFEIF